MIINNNAVQAAVNAAQEAFEAAKIKYSNATEAANAAETVVNNINQGYEVLDAFTATQHAEQATKYAHKNLEAKPNDNNATREANDALKAEQHAKDAFAGLVNNFDNKPALQDFITAKGAEQAANAAYIQADADWRAARLQAVRAAHAGGFRKTIRSRSRKHNKNKKRTSNKKRASKKRS